MQKKKPWILFLLIICLPLLWLNVKDSHDWGDDFASYLHQAQNICEGKPQSEIGYIYNPRFAILGPRAYTIGLPLLLSPLYAFFGHNIYVYLLAMSVLLLLFLVMMFIFLSNKMKPLYAFLFCLIIAYNPGTLYLKGEIMCDICIAFFLLLTIYCFERWKNSPSLAYPLLLGLMNGFLLSLKGTGIVLSAALLVMVVFKLLKHRNEQNTRLIIRNTLLTIITGGVIYALLNEIIFPTPRGGITHFTSLTIGEDYFNLFKMNFDNYVSQFNYFYS